MTKTADQLREEAARQRREAQESFERCDTDGFLTQWACGVNARLADAQAEIVERGGHAEFSGLYEGDRRVRARVILGQYGASWLLDDSEVDIIRRRGKKFLPTGKTSRVLKSLGLAERAETAPAWACLDGQGTGLSGAHTVYVKVYRTGCKWGSDAKLV